MNFKPVINGDDQREVVETNDVFDLTPILSSYTHEWRKRKRLQLQFGGCSWAPQLKPINFVIVESWFPHCKLLSSSIRMQWTRFGLKPKSIETRQLSAEHVVYERRVKWMHHRVNVKNIGYRLPSLTEVTDISMHQNGITRLWHRKAERFEWCNHKITRSDCRIAHK